MKYTDSHYLTEIGYKTDRKLNKRKALYQHLNPPIDLDQEIFNVLDLPSAKEVADVGCGNGDLLIHLAESGNFAGQLHGVDISRGILQSAIYLTKEKQLPVEWYVATAEKLPFAENTLDAIICKHVLYHVENIEQAVAEAYRCLKPGGRYVVVLNSLNKHKKLTGYNDRVLSAMGVRPEVMPTQRLNMENFEPYLTRFKHVELKQLTSKIELTDPSPYVDYIESYIPDDVSLDEMEKWQSHLALVAAGINKIIQTDGLHTDDQILGLFVATK